MKHALTALGLGLAFGLGVQAQDSRPASDEAPAGGISLDHGDSTLALHPMRVKGDGAAIFVQFSSVKDAKLYTLAPGETRVFLVCRQEWDAPKTVKVVPIADRDAFKVLIGDGRRYREQQANGTVPTEAGAVLVHNGTAKSVELDEKTWDWAKVSATAGTVELEALTRERFTAKVQLTFPEGKTASGAAHYDNAVEKQRREPAKGK